MPLPIPPGPPIDDVAPAKVGATAVDQGGGGGHGPPIVYRPGQGQPGAGAMVAGAPEELLKYGTALHQQVLTRLNSRRDLSQRHIGKRYDNWSEVDEHCRMFIDLSRRAKKAAPSTSRRRTAKAGR